MLYIVQEWTIIHRWVNPHLRLLQPWFVGRLNNPGFALLAG